MQGQVPTPWWQENFRSASITWLANHRHSINKDDVNVGFLPLRRYDKYYRISYFVTNPAREACQSTSTRLESKKHWGKCITELSRQVCVNVDGRFLYLLLFPRHLLELRAPPPLSPQSFAAEHLTTYQDKKVSAADLGKICGEKPIHTSVIVTEYHPKQWAK